MRTLCAAMSDERAPVCARMSACIVRMYNRAVLCLLPSSSRERGAPYCVQ